MKLMLKLVVLAALLSASLFAQNTSAPAQDAAHDAIVAPLLTHGLANGRFWTIQNKAGKVAWLDGYRTGLHVGAQMANLSDADFDDQLIEYWPNNLSFGETADAIDRFYSEPENVPVPVSDAVSVVSFKTGGASPSDLEEFVAKLRRLATQKESR